MSCFKTVFSKAKARVQSWHKTDFVAKNVREPIFGNIITITVAESAAYRIVMQDVRIGTLPPYTPYLLISIVAMFEAVLGPLVAWLGYKTRKRMMLGWSLGFMLISFAWFVIPPPDSHEETEFCDSVKPNAVIIFTALSLRTAVRVVITVGVAICLCLARVASWSHCIAYIDDHEPDRTSIHFGALVFSRVVPLMFGYKMLTGIVENTIMLQVLIIALSTAWHSYKIYFNVPNPTRQLTVAKALPPMEDRGFFRSLFRVLCNILAMSQMLAMGILVTALWGFAYNEEDIIKTNYNIQPIGQIVEGNTELLQYALALISVVYVGYKHSAPIRSEYEIGRGLRHVFKMTFLAILLYVAIVVLPPCKKGHVAGLEDGLYAHPQCSLQCGCVPKWKEYSPVCVVDTMTTYLSPCEAGCTSSFTMENLKIYANCSCAGPSGRVAPGACSYPNCTSGFNLHRALFTLILTFSMLAFQTQGMVILKSVDPRDKSIAMGMMWSVVAATAYVCGNNIFLSIALKTCSWYTGEKCQLYQQRFSYIIGFTCASLAFVSLGVNLVARAYLRTKRRNADRPERREEVETD